jgi:SAM-dependent methyltransferase
MREECGLMTPREEIIALLRGQVAGPVISCLGELGWLQRMTEGPFDHQSFSEPIDSKVFGSVMTYLKALDLLEPEEGSSFSATALGRSVFRRYGAFCILNSYERYMQSLRGMLIPDSSGCPQVNRKRNVIGSGALHDKKFFLPALKLLSDTPCGFIADIGCGDGSFLSHGIERFPQAGVLGVDLSPVAVEETLKRLRDHFSHVIASGVVSDGADVESWSRHVPRKCEGGPPLISLWFLVHEISRNDPRTVIDFFGRVREHCPDATVLMGEITRMPAPVLAQNRTTSVMPELTLLHDLSRQGLLSWDTWQDIVEQIPYRKTSEVTFDVIPGPDGRTRPSSFVWCLRPT